MRIQILGSAAAEAVPALWCECECCEYARKHGGKDIRRRCSYWVDDDTLVDFGPDANWQSVEFGIDLTRIKRVIFTHSHEDHLDPVELSWRAQYFSRVTKMIKLFGSRRVHERILSAPLLSGFTFDRYNEVAEKLHFEPVELTPGSETLDGDLEIIAVPAVHDPKEDCLNYILRRGGRSILIANDTGWWSEAGWDFVSRYRVDAAIIEATFALSEGNLDYDHGHLGAHAAIRFRDELVRRGTLPAGAKVVVNHFSHNGNPLHHKMEAYFAGSGIEVGYDGKVIEI